MALTEGNVEEGENVQSVTEETPHPADESSSPGPYADLEVDRPPVSTNKPDVPIAQSLVAGAGAPSPEPEVHPETYVAANAYYDPAVDKDNLAEEAEPPKRGPGRPKKEDAG